MGTHVNNGNIEIIDYFCIESDLNIRDYLDSIDSTDSFCDGEKAKNT